MKKIKLLFLLPILLLGFSGQAQFQDSLWVGKQTYNMPVRRTMNLNFNTDPMSIGWSALGQENPNDNPSSTTAGTGFSAITDEEGDLLFYMGNSGDLGEPNGNIVRIYNSDHSELLNQEGVFTDGRLLQTSVIVPVPNNPDKYYLF